MCGEKCPKECGSSKFGTLVLSAQRTVPLRPPFYSATKMEFFVADFSSLLITQIAKMSSFELVANVGGTLGLWVGISFMSVVDLVVFLAELGYQWSGRFQ